MTKKKTYFPQPLQDRLIVSQQKPETRSAGGIIIPDTAAEQANRGTVVAVGPLVGQKDTTIYPRVGDLVQYGEYAGINIEIEGQQYLVMKEADVLLILN